MKLFLFTAATFVYISTICTFLEAKQGFRSLQYILARDYVYMQVAFISSNESNNVHPHFHAVTHQ